MRRQTEAIEVIFTAQKKSFKAYVFIYFAEVNPTQKLY